MFNSAINKNNKVIKRKSRYTCVVKNCYSREGPGTRFYLFPKVEPLRKQWIENLRVEDIGPKTRKLLCNHHFEDICFVEDTLKIKKNSVPTLALGHNEFPKHINNIDRFSSERPTYKRKCCVMNCTPNPNSIFHRFPSDPQLRRKWCVACKIDEKDVGPRTYVCHEHFTYKYHGVRNVLKDGVPTVNLDIEEKRNEGISNSENRETDTRDECVIYESDEQSFTSTKESENNNRVLHINANLVIKLKKNVDILKDILLKHQEEIRKLKLVQAVQQEQLLQKDKKLKNLRSTIKDLLLQFKESENLNKKVCNEN